MRRGPAVLAAVGLAVAMLIAGSLGPFRAGDGSGNETGSTPVSSPEPLAVASGEGRLDAAIASLQASLRGRDRDWRSFASLGLAYLNKGRLTADPTYYSKAERALRRSLRLHPRGNFEANLGLGVLAAARHDFYGALRWGRRARTLDRFSADALGVIVDALVELGRYEAASSALQKMVDLRPDLSSYARISYLRELHGDVSGAKRAMATAHDFAAGDGAEAAWASYQLGELYFSGGQLRAARRHYRRGASVAPDYALPQAGLAKVAAARGDLEGAIARLEDVVGSYPSPEFVILLGDLYRSNGDEQQAAAQYELVEAIRELYEANGVKTEIDLALFNADHGLRIEETVRRARNEWRRRKSIHVADALAWSLYASGRYRRAMSYERRAFRLGTKSALFNFHAGMIALRLGDREAARRYLSTALEINPYFSFLHAGLAHDTLERLGSR